MIRSASKQYGLKLGNKIGMWSFWLNYKNVQNVIMPSNVPVTSLQKNLNNLTFMCGLNADFFNVNLTKSRRYHLPQQWIPLIKRYHYLSRPFQVVLPEENPVTGSCRSLFDVHSPRRQYQCNRCVCPRWLLQYSLLCRIRDRYHHLLKQRYFCEIM